MNTRRVNAYKNSNGIWFYIEEYHPEHGSWCTVGDTYEKLEHATVMVEHHNLVELTKEIDKLREVAA